MSKTKPKVAMPVVAMPAVARARTAQAPAVSFDRVLRHGTTKTLNGKSELSYCVGVDGKGEPQLRVLENSGGGSFSDNWVSLKAINAAFDRGPNDKPVGARFLLPIFRVKSSNCCYFTVAVLVGEGLLKPSEVRRRSYDRVDPAAWLAELKRLADGGGAASKKTARAKAQEVEAGKSKTSKKRAAA
jgi:hypothetical protein